jgi:hypothetical protein
MLCLGPRMDKTTLGESAPSTFCSALWELQTLNAPSITSGHWSSSLVSLNLRPSFRCLLLETRLRWRISAMTKSRLCTSRLEPGVCLLRQTSSYLEAYKMIRGITGIGAGNGPMMVVHDGFVPDNTWVGFMTGADRLALGEPSSLLTNRQPRDLASQKPTTTSLTAPNSLSPIWRKTSRGLASGGNLATTIPCRSLAFNSAESGAWPSTTVVSSSTV